LIGPFPVLSRRLWLTLAVAVVSGMAPAAAPAQAIGGIPFVIDGDTLGFGEMQVRLYGIDAPEAEQTCPLLGSEAPIGAWAIQTLRRLIGRDEVICHPLSRPAQGHVAAKCRTMAIADLGRAMVMAGFAWDFKRQGHGIYADDEAGARTRRLGVWAGEGECQPPWDWRRR
jgi:endonuclease YncB( thermonuclease family)